MEIVFERCAGLDVHKETVVACVRQPSEGKLKRRAEVRTFSTMTRGLPELAAWLQSERGLGTSAARRAIRSSGSSTMWVVPSR